MPDEEVPLTGGNVNAGVLKVGDTVRRHVTRASPTIHRLLSHLEAKGFAGSPRFLGLDDKGREMLSFLPGGTGIPAYIWQRDAPLVAAAKLLRQYHDATLDFAAPAGVWAFSYPDAGRHEVICHNDFAPYNFIYEHQSPYAIIDFDLAGPGPRLRDVAYAAYWMTPLSFNSADQVSHAAADARNGSRRLQLFCRTYGVEADRALFDMIAEVLVFMGDESQVRQVVGAEGAAKLKSEGHLAHWREEAAAFQAERSRLEGNIAGA